uniref:Short/branched chain specific acyl-CoA dehydrogenase, mitochondrial n=1 Tax=Heterorhabditis bacteriophora TaxID=37862 RepID=A0A1I7XLD4_HETBA
MDLERSLANINIDDNPWRSQHDQTPQPWGSGMPGGGASGGGQAAWGHMSPQQMRNPWQDPNALAQGVNEALGLGGGPSAQGGWGAPMGGPGDFGEAARIWSDPHIDQQAFNPMHSHHRGINGMMGDPSGDWMSAAATQSQQPLWSDPMKQEQDGYWKHQQGGGWGGPPSGIGGWPPRQMHPNAPPPQHSGHGQPRGPMMQQRGPPQGGWTPNGGMISGPTGKQPMPWEQQRINALPRGGMARGGHGGGRYPPSGMDMSVPPPIDLPMSGMGGMRQVPPPNAAGMWKPEMGGAPNGLRGPPTYNQMGTPFGIPSKPQTAPGQFPIGGVDDLMWHDPNGDLKKWQRDTGVSLWGDPEKYNEQPVRLWKVPEGEEEDLEVALLKCPVPQKKVDGNNDDGSTRLPFPIPSKRPIVVTGWGELPENDPNNPVKAEEVPPGTKWGDISTHPQHGNDAPWFLPITQPQPFAPDAPAWGQPPGSGTIPPGPSQPHTQAIAEQLKYAVDKGYLDMSILQQTNLPAHVLNHMNQMLAKIPALEMVEGELKQLVCDCMYVVLLRNKTYISNYRMLSRVSSRRVLVQGVRGLLSSGVAKPRHDVEGRTPPPITLMSEHELALKDTVKRFSNNVVRPLVKEMDEKSQMHQSVITGTFENGIGLIAVDPSVSVFVDVQNTLIVPLILQLGTHEQKEKYLSKACSEWLKRMVMIILFRVLSYGLPMLVMQAFSWFLLMRILPRDIKVSLASSWIAMKKGYQLEKRKTNWVFAPHPRVLYILITSLFSSDIRSLYYFSTILTMLLKYTSNNLGYKYAIECLNAGRIGIGAQMLGLAQGCYDATVPYLQERKQFGSRLIDFQGVQHQIAQIAVEIEAARLLVYNAARMKDNGVSFVKQAAMSKLYASQIATSTTSKCVELLGGVGFSKEFPVEKYYRDSKIGATLAWRSSNTVLGAVAGTERMRRASKANEGYCDWPTEHQKVVTSLQLIIFYK